MTRNSEYNAVDAVINSITIPGCVATDATSACTGVKINGDATITTTDASGGTTPRYTSGVEYLCCRDANGASALENATNADVILNNIYMNEKSTILNTYTFVSSST